MIKLKINKNLYSTVQLSHIFFYLLFLVLLFKKNFKYKTEAVFHMHVGGVSIFCYPVS